MNVYQKISQLKIEYKGVKGRKPNCVVICRKVYNKLLNCNEYLVSDESSFSKAWGLDIIVDERIPESMIYVTERENWDDHYGLAKLL